VPYLVQNDTAPADGYPESLTIRYRVYSAGTTTLLYVTPAKIFATPAIPAGCAVDDPNRPFSFDFNFSLLRLGDQLNSSAALVDGTQRLHVGINMELDCWDYSSNHLEADSGNVYSANLSGVAAPGNPVGSWSKTYPGKWVLGLNGVDRNGDLVNDALMITTQQWLSTGQNVSVFFVNAGNGTALPGLPGASYPLSR
jgi:hypothetical protein